MLSAWWTGSSLEPVSKNYWWLPMKPAITQLREGSCMYNVHNYYKTTSFFSSCSVQKQWRFFVDNLMLGNDHRALKFSRHVLIGKHYCMYTQGNKLSTRIIQINLSVSRLLLHSSPRIALTQLSNYRNCSCWHSFAKLCCIPRALLHLFLPKQNSAQQHRLSCA